VTHRVSGILSSPSTQAACYTLLASTAALAAPAALLAPGRLCVALLGGDAAADPSGAAVALARVAGATLLTSASVLYTLRVMIAQ
jgi:hypothetical protein